MIILFAVFTRQVLSQEQRIVSKGKFAVPGKLETDQFEVVAKEVLASIAELHSKDSEK